MTKIRDARPEDADAISEIARRGWVTAYAGLLPAEALERRTRTAAADVWREYLRAMPDGHWLLVAEQGGGVAAPTGSRSASRSSSPPE